MRRPTESSHHPVRVLVVGTRWPSRPFIDELLVALSGEGLSMTLATPPDPSRPPAPISTIRVPSGDRRALADPVGLVSGLLTLARHPAAGRRLIEAVRKRPIRGRSQLIDLGRCLPVLRRHWDVIYMPWVGTLVSHAALVGGEIPVVVSCRGSQILVARHNPERAEPFEAMAAALRNVTAIHCVSSDLGGSVESLGVPSDRIRVIRSGIDIDRFRPGEARNSSDRLRLVSVGRLHWKKGQEYLLIALRQLIDAGVPTELKIVGGGPDLDRLLYTRRDLGLEERVTFTGELDREALPGALRDSDLFVLPSLTEGISNAALEAMACGLPVVSTRVGGMPEAIRDGVDGLLVPPRDAPALVEALAVLWRDSELRNSMRAAARKRVVAAFDRGTQVPTFASLLREAARGRLTGRDTGRGAG